MKRAVFIGGFSNSLETVERTAEVLEQYYGTVYPFTFPDAMDDPKTIEKAVRRRTVLTQSAGFMALYGTRPSDAIAFGPPLPRSRTELMIATGVKSGQMLLNRNLVPEVSDAIQFHKESIAELGAFASRRTRGHWRYFLNGAISSFNSVSAGIKLRHEAGTQVELVYGDRDKYYAPLGSDIERAEAGGINLFLMEGMIHDALIIDPELTISEYRTWALPSVHSLPVTT